jgi:hypothetical protein
MAVLANRESQNAVLATRSNWRIVVVELAMIKAINLRHRIRNTN